MQMGSNNNGYRSLSVKAVGISAAVVSAGVMLHYTSGPSIFLRFASSEIPNLYRSLISWLTPPYLYFVINGIIISIAASSRFHKSSSGSHSQSQLVDHHHHHHVFESPSVSSVPTLVTKQQQQEYYAVASAPPPVVLDEEVNVGCVVPAASTADEEVKNSDDEKEEFEEEEFVMSRSSWAPTKTESVTAAEETDFKEKDQSQVLTDYSFSTEKPLVSSRLGRRKSLKATPEGGRTLRVSRPKRNDTLESTWRAITDGRAVPLTRHLKKSDTWEIHHHTQQQPEPPVVMRKCETFTERDGERGARRPPLSSGAAARLRKEPSIGQDDLNRRVEAFINKFNQEMKLQRQESFKHYLDMINRGSH